MNATIVLFTKRMNNVLFELKKKFELAVVDFDSMDDYHDCCDSVWNIGHEIFKGGIIDHKTETADKTFPMEVRKCVRDMYFEQGLQPYIMPDDILTKDEWVKYYRQQKSMWALSIKCFMCDRREVESRVWFKLKCPDDETDTWCCETCDLERTDSFDVLEELTNPKWTGCECGQWCDPDDFCHHGEVPECDGCGGHCMNCFTFCEYCDELTVYGDDDEIQRCRECKNKLNADRKSDE